MAAPGVAAELVLRDVEVGISALPTDFDFRVDAGTGATSGRDAFDAGTQLWGGVRWSFSRPGDAIGLVVGGDALLIGFTGSDAEMAGFGGRLCGGGGWAISDAWTLIAELGYTYGAATMSLDATTAAPSVDVDGTWQGYDARVSIAYRVYRSLSIQAYGGWLSASHDLSGDGLDLTIDRDGFYGGLAVVWRVWSAPPRLQ